MIEAIVFDLDGTLYQHATFERDFYRLAAALIGQSRGVSTEEGEVLLSEAIVRLEELKETRPSLSQVCLELGIDLPTLHQTFQDGLHPEDYLSHDRVLIALLESLSTRCRLYVYTNNNLPLSRKILALLGVDGLFDGIFAIEMSWQPKPSREALQKLYAHIGLPPEACLFVGDRPMIDLEVPADCGSPTLHVEGVVDLLQVHRTLGLIP